MCVRVAECGAHPVIVVDLAHYIVDYALCYYSIIITIICIPSWIKPSSKLNVLISLRYISIVIIIVTFTLL